MNLQLKVPTLSSPKYCTCLCFPGQLTTFLIWSNRHILTDVWKKSFYVWNTYSGIINIWTINKFRQLGYREWELCYIHVGSPSIFSMVTTDNCWHVVWAVIEALLIIRVVLLDCFPEDSWDFVEVIPHTITTTINTFGCLSNSQISSCYSLSKMTLSTPEIPILKIAIRVKELKWFTFEFFLLSDKGFSSSKFVFAMAFGPFSTFGTRCHSVTSFTKIW